MPLYIFKLDDAPVPGVMEELPDDASAKLHACIVADEIHRSARRLPDRVLVLDEDGKLNSGGKSNRRLSKGYRRQRG